MVSRQARAPFGKFSFVAAHRRLVWRKEETTDISRLAEMVNEASTFLRAHSALFGMIVLDVSAPAQNTEEVSEPAEEPVAEPAASDESDPSDDAPTTETEPSATEPAAEDAAAINEILGDPGAAEDPKPEQPEPAPEPKRRRRLLKKKEDDAPDEN